MIDPNYLVHVGMECGVALLPCTIPLCQAALHSFSDRLLQMSVVIAQYSFRTILKASDITYGFRVVTDADRQSLGVAYYCFDPSADALHTVGQDTSNSSRKRSHTECESRDSGDEGDSSFCSVSNVSTESWSSSGSGDTSQSDVGIDDAVESAIGEEEVYANRFANLDSSKISSADEALASRENCTIQEGPPADRNINCNRFPVAQIICSFNCTFQTSLELDETALTVLGDILQTQFELSLMGSPRYRIYDLYLFMRIIILISCSAICAKYDKMLVSIKEANYMLMLLAKIDGDCARPMLL